MKLSYSFFAAILLGAPLAGCATVPPKIMIQQEFHGDEKNLRTLMQDSGHQNEASKARLFTVYANVCDVNEQSAESNCKESKILDDVVPDSVY